MPRHLLLFGAVRLARQTIVKRIGSLVVGLSLVAIIGCGTTVTEPLISQVTAAKKSDAKKTLSESKTSSPQSHEVRKEITAADETGIPEVFLTAEHSAMCRVRVGDQLPAMSLPKQGGGQADLASLQGKKATVVLFWHEDPWMSETALKDIAHDVSSSEDVAVVGIAVKPDTHADAKLKKAEATFPQLLDNDGKVFNKVGMTKMPRVYVLDGSGKIVWFDIEYSESTHRELKQTLAVLTAGK
jgi:peroxiredoxin